MQNREIEDGDQEDDNLPLRLILHLTICLIHVTNNRKGQYAVDLVHPYRLVFEKHGDEIQIAHIMEIVDYH